MLWLLLLLAIAAVHFDTFDAVVAATAGDCDTFDTFDAAVAATADDCRA